MSETTITPTQELYLQLMGNSSFNSLDGPQVAAALRANRALWTGAVMVDDCAGVLTLRDLPDDYNSVCTLWITTTDPQPFERFAREWHADEFSHSKRGERGERGADDNAIYLNNDRLSLVRMWWD